MKAGYITGYYLISLGLLVSLSKTTYAGPVSLSLKPATGRIELAWPTAMTNSSSQQVFPEYEIEYSTDLIHWTPVGGKVRGIEGLSGPRLSLSLDEQPAPSFFRVIAHPDSATTNQLGDGGAQVFGYDDQFQNELDQLGFLPLEDFATNASNAPYLPELSWDPTTAQFWTNFDSTTLFQLRYGDSSWPTVISYNFQLSPQERAIFMTNGFVVSERLGSPTFGDAYYRIFNADLPVFITADSVLHAWHRSYQSMLSEVEELALATLLEQVLTNMSAQLPATWQQYGSGPLRESILDADFFLTVARSLWAGKQAPNALNVEGEPQRVADTLAAISSLAVTDLPLFGTMRTVDCSQFKIRGHYDASPRLGRYFQTMMWCGRIDLRLATFEPNKEDDIRQLGAAVVMQYLLAQSGQFTNWAMIDDITRLFVGETDSMTFAQLDDLLVSANILSPAEVPDMLTLTNLQTRLLTGELGVQNIHSSFFYSPFSPAQVKLPRSFTLTGQKFVPDSWVFSQVVFDRVLWDANDPRTIFGKVIRRKPSCLDVAFAVFDNRQAVPEIVRQINDTNGVPFRDGLPYQHNLLAARNTLQGQDPAAWTNSIYAAWLDALRSLSAPKTDPKYPEAMRTHAWAMKTLETQLASWTELRHDTLLYVKQSYTEPVLCGYPAGFVEPIPNFWLKMQQLAQVTAGALSELPLSGQVTVSNHTGFGTTTFNLAGLRADEVRFLNTFASQMATLQDMAERELAQQPFTSDETQLLKDVVERSIDYVGVRTWSGWYPALYYQNALNALEGYGDPFGYTTQVADCDVWDALVADVHTDLPDEITGDPGAVIHDAVGNVNMMLIAVDNGADHAIYAGPVFSHYEFEVPGVNRLSDPDWKTMLQSIQKPPAPEWTHSYLVPGAIPIPPGY